MEMNLKSLKNLSLETIVNDILDTYINVFKNILNFKGRAGKYEYWSFNLANEILFVLLTLLSFVSVLNKVVANISMLYWFVYLLPAIAVFVRRLHDTGRSALQLLYALLSALGGIIIIIFAMMLLKINDTNIAYSIGAVYGSFVVVAIFIYFLVLTFLPSKPDNKYGSQPQENSAQKTLANLFIIAVFALRIITASISMYYAHPEWHSSNTAEPSAHIYSHIQ